jgi:hypothetical protein
MALDGVKAGNRLLAFGTVKPGTCLNAVWRAFGSPKSDGRYPYSTAMQALKRARELGAIKGYNINDAPEGSILFWSNVWGNWSAGWSDAGHIAIKGPGNTVTTIDRPTNGVVGRVKPSGIWPHLKFEGYAYGPGAFMGLDVTPANSFTTLPAPASSASKPVPATVPEPKKKDDDVLKVFGNIDEGGMVYVFGEFTWQRIGSSSDAKNLTMALTGKPEAEKLYGGQINILKGIVEANMKALKAK